MRCPEYLIPFNGGSLLHIQRGNDKLLCRLIMRDGQVFFSHIPAWPVQRPLPFPRVVHAESILKETEILAKRIFKVTDNMTIRKNLIIEFCLKAGIPGVELLESCPAIVLLLAKRWDSDPSMRNFSQAVQLAGMKRPEILRYCRYPSAKWIAGLLQKVPASHCSLFLINDLKEIISKNIPEQIQILRHLSRISRLSVAVLKDDAISAKVARNFHQSAAKYPETDADIEADYLLYEIVRLSDELPEALVPLAQNIRDLQRIHDLYTEQYHILRGRKNMDQVFGKSPVPEYIEPGNEQVGIFPLTNSRKLFHEGEYMLHCIASYAYRISRDKNIYVYHVNSPDGEEATVLIRKSETTATWHIAEIRGIHNITISNLTRQFVNEWLAAYNQQRLQDNSPDHED